MLSTFTAEGILAHPRFSEARSAHLDAMVALFCADRFVARMMSDARTIVLRAFLVGLHLSFNENDPTTWATPGNVRDKLVAQGLASPRAIDDMLAEFRTANYIEPTEAPADRRKSLLVPSSKLILHDREHLAAYHRFLLVLCPGRGYEWVVGESEAAHRAFRRESLGNPRQAMSALRHPAIMLFLAREAGFLALLLLLKAEVDGTLLTWTTMAGRLGVARSHLRRIFGEAEAAGYVHLYRGRGAPINILPELRTAYDRFLAGVQADQDAIAQCAFRRVESSIG